jgi:hypothetical protein
MKKIFLFCLLLFFVTKITIAQTGDPLILLELPEKTFMGATVEVTGSSIKYETTKNVRIVVSGPQNYAIDTLLPMDNDGNYFCIWEAPQVAGDYKFVMYSSDKKKTTTKSIKVELVVDIQEMATDNISSTKKAITTIEDNLVSTKKTLTNTDATALDKKFKEVKISMEKMVVLYLHINDANKKIASLVSAGKAMPSHLSRNLSELQKTLKEIKEKENKAAEFLNHKATAYTICDALNGLKECLAAFSTISNFGAKTLRGVVKNIAIDKGIPFATGKFTEITSKVMKAKPPTDAQKFGAGEAGKIFATVSDDVAGLQSVMGVTGLAGDIITFIADILLKTYCGTFSGTVKQTYKFRNFNKSAEDWWIYTGILEASITLRYPKASNTGNIIKMKGYIEGNATKFTFGADPKKAIRDEIKQDLYEHTKLIKIFEVKPPTIPFSSATVDKETFGFGFGARMLATPACFNILVDAEYNQETKEVKLFLNEATIDFSPAVKFRQLYAFVKYALAYELNYQDYPVAKAFKTMKKNLEDKNYFPVTIDANKNPSFKGNVKKKINVVGQEIDLSFDVDATKE